MSTCVPATLPAAVALARGATTAGRPADCDAARANSSTSVVDDPSLTSVAFHASSDARSAALVSGIAFTRTSAFATAASSTRAQMPEEPLGVARREQVRAIPQPEPQPLRLLRDEQRQVELRLPVVDRVRPHRGAAQSKLIGKGVLHRQHAAEQWRVAGRLLAGAQIEHELLERNVLVLERVHRPFGDPLEQAPNVGSPAKLVRIARMFAK